MRAVTVSINSSGDRDIQYDPTYPKPTPLKGEALLEVIMTGICGTDLEIVRGYKNISEAFVLGHEFVARIVQFGPSCEQYSNHFEIGQRVVAEINCVSYGTISSRNAEERAQDPTRTALGIFGKNGAFADYVTVPVQNLHLVPDNISDASAIFVEPLAAACQILEQIQIPGTSKIAVIGAGRLGWIVTQVLAAFGKQITVIAKGKNSKNYSVEKSKRNSNLADSYGSSLLELDMERMEESLLDSFDIVVDCTGNPTGLELAIQLVRPRGTIILKSTTSDSEVPNVSLTPIVIKEVQIVGSRCGPFPVAIELLKREKVNPTLLIDAKFDLAEAKQAFQAAESTGCLKCILRVK